MSEDGFFIVIGLVVLAIPVAVIVLGVMVTSQRRRLRDLEGDVSDLRAVLEHLRAQGPQPSPARAPDAQPKAAIPEAGAPDAVQSQDGPWQKTSPAAPTQQPSQPQPDPEAPPPSGPTPPPPGKVPPGPLPSPSTGEPGFFGRAIAWLATNWFYVVAAASLSLAGIFLVQYGVERGLLPPRLRIAAAALFGAALIAAGEWVRRRYGDEGATATAYLPSVFSGAGVVTIFGAILAARHLYDMTGAGATLGMLSIAALAAIVLGWFHGPLLVAVGLVGGAVAPFVVGGASEDVDLLHGYFAVLGVIGLAVDAMRRWLWRWVSWLALGASFGGSALLLVAVPASALAQTLSAAVLVCAALSLPVRRLWPDHGGAMVIDALRARTVPPMETLLPLASLVAATALAVFASQSAFWPALFLCAGLVAALALWAARAWALQDQTVVPAIGLLAILALSPQASGETWALLVAGAVALAAAVRSMDTRGQTHPMGWALGAVAIAPAAGLVLDITWQAGARQGAYIWGLHALAVAAGLTVLAGTWAARDGEDRIRASLAALFAFTVIGYGLGQIAGPAALTASVAGLAAGAALVDRKLNLPLLSWFVVLAAPFSGWRLLGDPGWGFALNGPLWQVALSFGGVIAGFAVAWWLTRGRDRVEAEVSAETAMLSALGLAGILTVWRGSEAMGWESTQMILGLTASIWLLLCWVQLTRMRRMERLRAVRQVLAWLFGAFGIVALFLNVTLANPFLGFFSYKAVFGPVILNTFLFAYLLPGLLLMTLGHRVLRWAGMAVIALWVMLNIRLFWNGAGSLDVSNDVSQGEITTYTIVLLLLGAGLFYQGIATRRDAFRRAGTAVLGLTAAKVFLVDAASLSGLVRVAAFIALAFALVGLAWLNRWAGGAPMGNGPVGPTGGGPEEAAEDDGPPVPHEAETPQSKL